MGRQQTRFLKRIISSVSTVIILGQQCKIQKTTYVKLKQIKRSLPQIVNSVLKYKMVFGDDLNDIEMLSEFPISIAMGNAEETVKQTARYTTLSNESDGIYYALKNILNLI